MGRASVLVAAAVVAVGTGVTGPAASAVSASEVDAAGAANARRTPLEFDYARPPRVGDTVHWQRDLVRCASARGARYTAATGFFAADCSAAPRDGRWRVLACTHAALADGGLWLVEVEALGASPDAAGGGKGSGPEVGGEGSGPDVGGDGRGRGAGGADSPLREWIPLPWHDWA